ncbi:hypothetical protein TVAG_053060 [Trichomonas vaginalis G3]|uniref:receptor protein-tyrosine kinase n=1 Tax=Trichomonas vaginalis (strain ATCC PRA-98 / G3) TaxID=412133 RepID=A2F6L8_TRIV3|nr:glycine-rich protein family [Trichomonas vaginalis G3]EAX99463.1 hypothetical protein TVAG_053060 [Trichomonas vaginalis G3]KAI5541646.1 glycine-rich protein family [Trichomonas vaginalis G3]|eukprot:XP_001312393.1 hypothetical protein [Trichomonas vaginalis G3]
MTNPPGGCGAGGKGGKPSVPTHFSGAGGGGATIIYYDTQNLPSRIMVSGGGGENLYGGCTTPPGYGGGLVAGNGGSLNKNLVCQGGTQKLGTQNGVGQDGRNSQGGLCGDEGNPGCGGGYMGGMTTKQ